MSERMLRMSLDDYGNAIRSAYVEGYIQGEAHPRDRRVIDKAQELAMLFWRVVKGNVAAKSAERSKP